MPAAALRNLMSSDGVIGRTASRNRERLGTDMDLSLDYEAPDARLRDLISSYYWFRSPPLSEPLVERADRAQFRFLLRGEGSYEFCDGVVCKSAPVSIVGPTTGSTTGRVEGAIEIFGAGLQPAGWGLLMGAEAEKGVNRLIDAETMFGAGVLELRDAIAAAPDLAAKVSLADEFFGTILSAENSTHLWFTRLVDDWLAASPSPAVSELVAASGRSARQVERMMKRYYGAPPKLIARKYRALKASSDFLRDGDDGRAADGFYDQSHLTRELKHFTGLTPARARDEPPQLIRKIIEGRSKLAGKVDRLISDT